MKLLITESKRNKIITKYLDKYYSDLSVNNFRKYGVKHYIDPNGFKIFLVEDNTLWLLNKQLTDDLVDLFGIDITNSDDILIPWFEETYGDNIFRVKVWGYHK
jgi:hypothetical protein